MAEVNVTALAAIAPVAQRNAANQGSSAQAGQTEQSSFAQVLKSRSQTQNAPKAQAGKDPAKSSDTANASSKASSDTQANDSTQKTDPATNTIDPATQATAVDPALLLAAAGVKASNSTTSSGTSAAAKSPDELSAGADNSSQSSLPSLAASTAALAGQAARLAGQTSPADQATDTAKASTDRFAALASSAADARQSSDEVSVKTDASKITVSTDAVASKLADDKSASFATELANASLNLNPGTSPQTTHGILGAAQISHSSASLPQHQVSTPVTSPAWADEVGQKVSWIANRDNGRAELILTPPQMGRVEVSISMSGDQASATFIAASPAAREALQDAMPHLREVLAQSGIQLGQANVNAGFSGQTQSDNPGNRSTASRFATQSRGEQGNIDSLAGSTRASWTRQGNGMIDTFA